MEILSLEILETGDYRELSILPQEVNQDFGTVQESNNYLKLGEVINNNGTRCETLEWEGMILKEVQNYVGITNLDQFISPEDFDEYFRKALKENYTFRIMLTGSNVHGDYKLASYHSRWVGGPIRLMYSVSFTEYRVPQITIEESAEELKNNCYYNLKVKDHGWGKEAVMGEITGTSGQCLATEEFTMRTNLEGVKAEYQVHVSNAGWIPITEDNHPAGRAPEMLEAIKIRLTGENSGMYDVYYRVHVQNEYWMEWHKNWEEAGTTGRHLRLEAIQILIVPKGTFYKYDQYLPIADDHITYAQDCMTRVGKQNPNGSHFYQIIPNDTLWNIAADFYGDGTLWEKIYEANRKRNPLFEAHNLIVGEKIFIP